MKINQFDKTPNIVKNTVEVPVMLEDSHQIPEPGDNIRTKKTQMEGKVERLGQNRAGYDEVYFRIADGRLMKTPLENVIVVEKLEDEDDEIMEGRLDEVSTELLAKYKTAAGKSASEADKDGDFKKGDKRFSGIVKATKKQFDNDKKKTTEGTMGGINRCAPATDVSYDKVLNDVTDKWKGSTVTVKETGPYADRFEEILEAFNASDFADILGKEHQKVQAAKKSDVEYIPSKNPNFTIRFRPQTSNLTPVHWQVLNQKKEIVGDGKSSNDKEAYNDAEDWIATSNQGSTANSNVTVNFNAAFARAIAPEGNTLWVDFWEGPTFVYSDEPQDGYKKTVIRTQAHARTQGAALLPVTTLSPKEANKVGLKADMRYTLGPREELDTNIYGFPLIPHSRVEKGVMVPIKEPSISTSQSQQSLQELDKSTLGSYIKKSSRDVADRVSSSSFVSGKKGDAYNKADETHKEKKRQAGIDKAADRLSK